MSRRNGDKARFGRQRKEQIHRREKIRELRICQQSVFCVLAIFYAKRIPLLAEEGWLRHQRKCREATETAQTGWSDRHPSISPS